MHRETFTHRLEKRTLRPNLDDAQPFLQEFQCPASQVVELDEWPDQTGYDDGDESAGRVMSQGGTGMPYQRLARIPKLRCLEFGSGFSYVGVVLSRQCGYIVAKQEALSGDSGVFSAGSARRDFTGFVCDLADSLTPL